MALDIKKIIKQETAKVMLEQHLLEAETPDHFGGGENIEIYGYKTENFDICKSAVILFNKIKEENLEGMAVDHAKKSAEHLDKVFGIEKDVVEEGSASPEQIEEAIDNNMLFGYELGSLAMHTNNDYTRDTGFAKMHVMEIANRYDGTMTEYGANTTYGTSFAHGSAEEEVSESKINEISVKAGLEDVMKGRTSAIEGIKMSKELATNLMFWIKTSAYGRKYGKQIMKARIASLIGPANAMGFGDRLKPKLKGEWKDIVKKHGPKREVKEAAPGYMHDCASKVIHKEHGAGTCIPEQHNLVKEGNKWVVTEYDVKFDSGKIVKNVPVNELKIVSESHHGHKRRKKRKKESIGEAKIKKGSIVIAKSGVHKGEKHEVIHDFGNGKYNIRPMGLKNKYRMGAASASEKDLKLVKETSIQEKIANLTTKQKAKLKEKLVFYKDNKDRLRRFDTDKAANKRLSR